MAKLGVVGLKRAVLEEFVDCPAAPAAKQTAVARAAKTVVTLRVACRAISQPDFSESLQQRPSGYEITEAGRSFLTPASESACLALDLPDSMFEW